MKSQRDNVICAWFKRSQGDLGGIEVMKDTDEIVKGIILFI